MPYHHAPKNMGLLDRVARHDNHDESLVHSCLCHFYQDRVAELHCHDLHYRHLPYPLDSPE